MPKWWKFEYDKYLLYALARFGCIRPDLIYQESDLPFGQLYEEYMNSAEAKQIVKTESDEKPEDTFWMKETVAMKRMEILVNACIKGSSKAKKRQRKLLDEALLDSDIEDIPTDPFVPGSASKLPRLKFTVNGKQEQINLELATENDHDGESSSGDTDEMLEAAAKIIEASAKARNIAERATEITAEMKEKIQEFRKSELSGVSDLTFMDGFDTTTFDMNSNLLEREDVKRPKLGE